MEDWNTVAAFDTSRPSVGERHNVWTSMAKSRSKTTRKPSTARAGRAAKPSSKPRFYSTSDGRTNFAGLIQAASVDKEIIGFERYGHSIAALVPIEAIWLLADETVSADTKRRIRRMASAFVSALPEEGTQPRSRRRSES